jgi:predicted KAP-like P-loop ATPase
VGPRNANSKARQPRKLDKTKNMGKGTAAGSTCASELVRHIDARVVLRFHRTGLMGIFSFLKRLPIFGGEADEASRETPFSADIPIMKAEEDLLDRKGFAETLARFIYDYRGTDSPVLALRGDWGSGKTSIKNLVVAVLRNRDTPMTVVTFNPWQFGTDEAITRAFFREISVALGENKLSLQSLNRAYNVRRFGDTLERISGRFRSSADHATNIAGFLTGLGLLGASGMLGLDWDNKKIASILLGTTGVLVTACKGIAVFWRDRQDNRPVELARTKLEERLTKLKRNLLIVIDDIDRLEPEQIRTVIRHLKANASLPGLIYLLLYQRKTVEAAFDASSSDGGASYMEKIVQAPFDVPAVEGGRVGTIVLNELNRITTPLLRDVKFDQVRWGNVWFGGLQAYFRNLRDAKRFIGAAEVQFGLHRGSRVLETNLIDLTVVEALRLFEPDLFAAIGKNKKLLTRHRRDRRPDEDGARIRTLLDTVETGRLPAAQYLMKQLFPPAEWAFEGGTSYAEGFDMEWTSEKRICTDRYFDRYFTFRIPMDQISDSELVEFIENSGDRARVDEAFADLRSRGLLPEMLARLDDAAVGRRLPITNSLTLVPAIFDVAEAFKNEMGFGSKMPFIAAWRTVSWFFRCEPDAERRGELFLDALRVAHGLSAPAFLMSLEEERREKQRDDGYSLLSDRQLQEAKTIWTQKADEMFRKDAESVLQKEHFGSLLHNWQRWQGNEVAAGWLSQVVAQDRMLVKVLQAFTTVGQSQSFGDYVAGRLFVFELKSLQQYVDTVPLVARVENLTIDLDEAEREACSRFLKAMRNKQEDPPRADDPSLEADLDA